MNELIIELRKKMKNILFEAEKIKRHVLFLLNIGFS